MILVKIEVKSNDCPWSRTYETELQSPSHSELSFGEDIFKALLAAIEAARKDS